MTSHIAGPGGGLALNDITVVVPTKNEAENIERFLNSLPPTLELVVVDSSDDHTPHIVEAQRPRWTTVIWARANIPVARQIGSATATTRWLLFTDADVTFAPSYFERLTQIPVDASTAGIVGVKGSGDGFRLYYRWFVRGQAALMGLGIPAATGSNMLVAREVLHAVGGFDPDLSVNEDTELMFRVARSGHRVVFRPDLSVRAFDDRRLELGIAHKIIHGAVRNTALYLGIFPERLRSGDWGYWSRSIEASERAS